MRRLFWIAVVINAGLAAVASAQLAQHRGSPQAGRRLALHACDTCHIVAADQQIRPLITGYAPSFFDVADKPGITAQSLEDFLAHRHPYGKMPYPELSAAQVADLASYILSLHRRR